MKTNNSFFSPNRLVFMAGPEAPQPQEVKGEKKADAKPDLSTFDGRLQLQTEANKQIMDMQLSAKPDQKKIQRLKSAVDRLMTAEFSASPEGQKQKVAEDLYARLQEITGNAPEKGVDESVARAEIAEGRNLARERAVAEKALTRKAMAMLGEHPAEGQQVTVTDSEGKAHVYRAHGVAGGTYAVADITDRPNRG